MAFFNKLNDLAKNITDKTNDAIETGKLNSRANSEKNLAAEELKKIGTYYYEKFTHGEEVDAEILDLLNAAKAHYDEADAALAEIEKIRLENEAQKAAAAAPVAPAAPVVPATPVVDAAPVRMVLVSEATGDITCPGCGALNAAGIKFCGECGTKLEIPQPPAPKTCPNCGMEVVPGLRFCGECGTRLE